MTDKELIQQAKDELSQIKKNDKLIQQMLQAVQRLRSNLTSTSTELKPDKVQSSHRNDQMVETIAKIIDLEREVNCYIDDLCDLKRDAFRVISRISDLDQRTILVARYINFKKWGEVAQETRFSIQRVFEIHSNALRSYSELKVQDIENRVKQTIVDL